MKILLGADTYPPDINGAARFTQRLAGGLRARGHDVHVVCPSWDGPQGEEVRDGIVVHRMRSRRWPLHEQFRVCLPGEIAGAVSRVVAQVAPDVVHAQAHFVVGRHLVQAAAAQRRPLVATNHFMPENLLDQARIPARLRRTVSEWAWADLARTFRHAQIVTAPTPRAVDLLHRRTPLQGAVPVSCGIDPLPYAEAARRARDASDRTGAPAIPTILFVGRLDAEKRVGELIDALAALPPPARLRIVGDGTMREAWRAQVARLDLSDRVTFSGFVDDDELLAAYAECDVFVMPGIAELQSLVTLEAMSAGKPIVAADAMALPHLVRPGRNGWLYTPGDVPQLTLRLATLLSDHELRARMGRASSQLVAEHALSATLATFEEIYADAIAQRAGVARQVA